MLVGLFAGNYAVPRRSGLHWNTFYVTFSENILTGLVERDKCGQRVALVRKYASSLWEGTVRERLLDFPCPLLCLSSFAFSCLSLV
jgi:hypothetical protein